MAFPSLSDLLQSRKDNRLNFRLDLIQLSSPESLQGRLINSFNTQCSSIPKDVPSSITLDRGAQSV